MIEISKFNKKITTVLNALESTNNSDQRVELIEQLNKLCKMLNDLDCHLAIVKNLELNVGADMD